MRVEDSIQHYFEKFNEVLEVVEKECVKGNDDFVGVLSQHIYWSTKYLQNLFGYIADISLKNYVRRRRLTEAFYEIEDFTSQKMTYAVNGIANAKRKIIKEFGEKPEKLQAYLYDEVSEETLKRRLEWKIENGLNRKKVVNSGRMVLYSASVSKQKYNLDRTYFILDGRYWAFIGNYIGKSDVKDDLLSAIFQKNVYIAVSCHESANQIVECIYRSLKGVELTTEKAMKLYLDVEFEEGFEWRNLVTKVSMNEEKIIGIEVDPILKIEENELVFDMSSWLNTKDIKL